MSDMDDLTAFWAARLDEAQHLAQAYLDHAAARKRPGPERWAYQEVLAGIAADRAILDLYREQSGWDLPAGVHDGRDGDEQMRDEAVADMLEQVVKIRAARFAGHPDYRAEEWAP